MHDTNLMCRTNDKFRSDRRLFNNIIQAGDFGASRYVVTQACTFTLRDALDMDCMFPLPCRHVREIGVQLQRAIECKDYTARGAPIPNPADLQIFIRLESRIRIYTPGPSRCSLPTWLQ